MTPGVKYELNGQGVEKELWRQETTYRLSGGFNLDIANLQGGARIPPATPLAIDFATRKAVVCKNVAVIEAVASGATSIKVGKGSFAYVGMFLGNGTQGVTVSEIDKTNTSFDLLTVSETTAAISVGTVLFESSTDGGTAVKNKAFALNYTWTMVQEGATVTAVGQAFEIQEKKLYVPISKKDKCNLGDRFMFV